MREWLILFIQQADEVPLRLIYYFTKGLVEKRRI